MKEIRKVGVVGCGLMGSGIAQVAAQSGFQTVVREVDSEALDRGIAGIEKRLRRLVEKGELGADESAAAMERTEPTTELSDLASCDIVIEAIVEDRSVKNDLWRELEDLCPAETIFASNTSSLTISEMAAVLQRPERLIGLHFFNPVPVMALVEVIRTLITSDETFQRTWRFCEALGKEPIECRDASGFVVNLLLVPFMMDAIRALESGVASVMDIDRGMKLGAGHPMGPLTLCDFVGLDTLARIGDIMFDEYRETRYAAPPLLKRMVSLGFHGRKAGRGFYDYATDPPEPLQL